MLWINDRADEYLANGDALPHGHVYEPRCSAPSFIQVSFEALNGTSIRASFDMNTGEVTTHDITEYQR